MEGIIMKRDLEVRTSTSDKIYIVRLYQQDATASELGTSKTAHKYYVVDCWYGRRMGPYKYLRKIRTAYLRVAQNAYDKIINEKVSKGYSDFTCHLHGPWEDIQDSQEVGDNTPERIFVSDSDCRTSSDDDRKKALERLANSGGW
jgi:hypothetical protein